MRPVCFVADMLVPAKCAASPSSRALLVVSDALRRLFVSDMVARGRAGWAAYQSQSGAAFRLLFFVLPPRGAALRCFCAAAGRLRADQGLLYSAKCAALRSTAARTTAYSGYLIFLLVFDAAGARRLRRPPEALLAGARLGGLAFPSRYSDKPPLLAKRASSSSAHAPRPVLRQPQPALGHQGSLVTRLSPRAGCRAARAGACF
jgi:hypothetical protein